MVVWVRGPVGGEIGWLGLGYPASKALFFFLDSDFERWRSGGVFVVDGWDVKKGIGWGQGKQTRHPMYVKEVTIE